MKKLITKLKNLFLKKEFKSEIISENPKIIKFTIPVGNISREKAEKELSKLISNYKEDINFGETYSTITNLPNYYTNDIWFPEKK
jgi:hypothetical protein